MLSVEHLVAADSFRRGKILFDPASGGGAKLPPAFGAGRDQLKDGLKSNPLLHREQFDIQ